MMIQEDWDKMSSSICDFRLDGIMTQISISLKPDLIMRIDEAAGVQSRSAFIVGCIHEHFNPTFDVDKTQLLAQLEANKVQQMRLENEVTFLREQNMKLTDAMSQRLLSESPKKSFWSRFRRS
jgi:hypothetical protein